METVVLNDAPSDMEVRLDLNIQAQPNGHTCGPTCLQAVYRYFGERIQLESIIADVPTVKGGGTIAVWLGCHALQRGYQATIYQYDLSMFDPTWFDFDHAPNPDRQQKIISERLKAQRKHKKGVKLRAATDAFIEFLERGGQLRFEDLTKALIRRYLNHSIPILTGLCATYLYRCPREFGPLSDYDDIRGEPMGHFVILSGYNKEERTVRITDPLLPNPVSSQSQYEVSIDRVLCAILLGTVTNDANLLIIQPK